MDCEYEGTSFSFPNWLYPYEFTAKVPLLLGCKNTSSTALRSRLEPVIEPAKVSNT